PEILSHRLGKRCILRLRFETRASKADAPSHGSVIAKLYKSRTERAQQVFTEMRQLRAQAFGDGSSMTVPAPIAYLPDEKIVLMEDDPGISLAELSGPTLLDGFAAAGRALAELHGSAVVVSGRHTVEDEIAL